MQGDTLHGSRDMGTCTRVDFLIALGLKSFNGIPLVVCF